MTGFAKYTVLELGRSLPGALCGSHLGALGMAVRACRTATPPGATTPADLGWDWSKTITGDMPADADLAAADVVLTDDTAPPGTSEDAVVVTFRADYDEPAAAGPELLLQARSGLVGYVGRQRDMPIRIGAPVVTYATAVAGAQAVLAALLRRERTGRGAAVAVSGLAVAIALAGNNVTAESDPDAVTGFAAQPNLPPRFGFRCADGTVDSVFHQDDGGFAAFCEWLGRPELAADPRFADYGTRLDNEGELGQVLEPELARRPAADVLDQLEAVGALCALRYPVPDLTRHPQLTHLELLTDLAGRTVAQVPFTLDGERPRATEPRTVTS
jgi:crotonobetainyl-CoA:carnitine CoA-transferase CaiB-like acyl-CoA transferase